MRRFLLTFSGCVLFAFAAFAGGNGNGQSPDQQWQSLKSKSDPITTVTADPASVTQAIATYLANADALKNFYTQNPTHAAVKDAKRLEALSLLGAEVLGEKSQKGRARQLVKDLRSDATIDVELREQLAACSDNLDTEEQNGGGNTKLADYEQTARALQAEFPASSSIYESLNGIAASSADDRAAAIATDLLAMPAPAEAKGRAQILLNRLALKGTSIADLADTALGTSNPVRAAAGQPVVIYTWSAAAPSVIATIKGIVPSLPAGVMLVGVCVDQGDLSAAHARASTDQPPGTQLYDPMGFMGKFAGPAQLTTPGLIYIADRKGVLVSVSAQQDVKALIQTVSNL